jgi:hypothetical protein
MSIIIHYPMIFLDIKVNQPPKNPLTWEGAFANKFPLSENIFKVRALTGYATARMGYALSLKTGSIYREVSGKCQRGVAGGGAAPGMTFCDIEKKG